jgi:FKBP-type peptidyl-prolyl cis-trans isomerase SlyD
MVSAQVGPDTLVVLSYKLYDEAGEVVDEATAAEPLSYVHGYAQVLPGLEKALAGLKAGDKAEVVIDPADAFGEHDQAGIFEVDREDFPESNEVGAGDEFVAHGPDGEPIAMRVVEVRPEAFVVDTNHPLAGQRVRFEVEVASVRAADEHEIARAQAELEERAHDASCCDHDHDHGHDHNHDHSAHHHEHAHGEPLVQLSGRDGRRAGDTSKKG